MSEDRSTASSPTPDIDSIAAVEFGGVLPRVEHGPRRWPYLLFGGGLLLLAGTILVARPFTIPPPGVGTPGAVAGLSALAIGLIAIPFTRRERSLPQFAGISLTHLSRIDPACAADHLVGRFDGAPRGLPSRELVISPITPQNADNLAQVARECEERWQADDLHRILIGIPQAPPEVLEEVAEAYDATILVDAPGDLPALLQHLPDVLTQPEADALEGIGSVSIRRRSIAQTPPTEPGLREDIVKGRGKPLSGPAAHLRDAEERSPTLTILAAPQPYLGNLTRVVRAAEDRFIRVELPAGHEIELVRVFLADTLPEDDEAVSFKRPSIRENGDSPPNQRDTTPARDAPAEDAPPADPTLQSRC